LPIMGHRRVSTHSEIVWVDAPTMLSKLIEVLLRHVEALLVASSHEPLVGRWEELILGLVFDVGARCVCTSHGLPNRSRTMSKPSWFRSLGGEVDIINCMVKVRNGQVGFRARERNRRL